MSIVYSSSFFLFNTPGAEIYRGARRSQGSSPEEKLLERAKQKRGVKQDHELLPEDLEKLVKDYKACVQLQLGEDGGLDEKVLESPRVGTRGWSLFTIRFAVPGRPQWLARERHIMK